MKLMMLMNKDEELELKKIRLAGYEEKEDYEEMFDCLETILDNHPKTWKKYKGTVDECDSIINMEIQELMDAKKEKDFCELAKEYMHCAAAFLYGYQKSLEMKEKHHYAKEK